MWKAFQELRELGWLKSDKMPRLVGCQAEGCAPIVRAFEKGERFAQPVANAQTVASGLRVPSAVGDFMMLDAIRASGGRAVAGREAAIGPWMGRAGSAEGISICPTAVCLDVLERLVGEGVSRTGDHRTGAAQVHRGAAARVVDKDRDVAGQVGL